MSLLCCRRLSLLLTMLGTWGIWAPNCIAASPTLEWTRQWGTPNDDYGRGVSADRLGNVYITGYTWDTTTRIGEAFVQKYDNLGDLQWSRQLGTSATDYGLGISVDGVGHVYITGYTGGNLGGINAGGWDAYISKYDASGTPNWTKQQGTSADDESWSVSADHDGNVFIAGYTSGNLGGTNAGGTDAFVAKYDASGTLAWAKQLGTRSVDFCYGVSTDGLGNVYITGRTGGNLVGPSAGSWDAFVAKYDATGNLAWTKQLGTSSLDESNGVTVDELGNVYITGRTLGELAGTTSAGDADAFISKYDTFGALAWTRQLGTSSEDISYGVAADGLGNIYVTGYTEGSLSGNSAGDDDAFVAKYDAAGNLAWTYQLGTSLLDYSYSRGISTDGLGNIYISGFTYGSLGASNAGGVDVFVSKLHDPDAVIPEPSTLILTVMGGVGLGACRRRWVS